MSTIEKGGVISGGCDILCVVGRTTGASNQGLCWDAGGAFGPLRLVQYDFVVYTISQFII